MRTITLDLETTITDGSPSPWDIRNRVVLAGIKEEGKEALLSTEMPCIDRDVLLVGQNLSFEIAWLIRTGACTMDTVPKNIWDIQLAEYLLTGQLRKYASMDEMADKYKLPLKDDKVKVFFDAGLGSDHVPMSLLEPYLEHDLAVTEAIYLKQRAMAEEKGMMPLIQSQMRARWATSLMECNGLSINWEYVEENINLLHERIESLLLAIETHVDVIVKWPTDESFNPLSNKHVSALLFGSPIKWKEKERDGFYKNGNEKWKTVEKVWCNNKAIPTSAKMNSRNEYPVDDDVLKNISDKRYSHIAEQVRQLRTYKKWKETYYENLRTFRSSVDSRIHPSLNHVSTDTGRLSCTKPNIQNQTTDGGVKDCYISRWGDDGVLLDIDYSQLEVAGLAAITKDIQLLADLNSGTDIHTALFEDMYKHTPTKDERKKFKPRTFLTIYGGGPTALSTQTGISKEEAKRFIQVFYTRYPGVLAWHNTMVEEAKKNRIVTKERSPIKKHQVGVYVYKSMTGRRYVFKEWENEWKGGMSFSPTQLKNWAVQGFATGDVVPHMVGHICDSLYSCGLLKYIVPICTVHDSVLFDVHKNHLSLAKESLCAILNQTKPIVEEWFSLEDLGVVFKVEASAGPTWGSVETI